MPARIPLLFLPGLLCDGALFAAQLEGLADIADMRVADVTRGDTVAALADDALRQAPAPRFALAGLSMGGYVAHEILRRAPSRVMALALIDTSARPDTAEATANRRRLIGLARRDFDAVAETLLPKLMHADHVADTQRAEVVRAMAKRTGVAAFERQEQAIIGRPDSRADLARIEVPTLVLAGADDALIAREAHEEQAQGIRGATLTLLERCGHLATLEQPATANAALRGWLGRCIAP